MPVQLLALNEHYSVSFRTDASSSASEGILVTVEHEDSSGAAGGEIIARNVTAIGFKDGNIFVKCRDSDLTIVGSHIEKGLASPIDAPPIRWETIGQLSSTRPVTESDAWSKSDIGTVTILVLCVLLIVGGALLVRILRSMIGGSLMRRK